ncbi:polysaccharide deacetylase family protein [Pontixanthobacter aquaemixtae]|uniref:Polysaccharide deacetylase family protein n=1 Tax=Pontixanthobacter aquaemixtae TaxID=1958940 RepID=A0A844ZQL1_9SPHN|nr:polysaccharide deacetylase family protein [Pontixanthobacter aquaemixtae]MXO89316.1 polysaccharide deacetylase family protein [Pontixanthobacter aquaemixtae]
MTAVYITIDTEYSAGFAKAEGTGLREENFRRSIACETPDGDVGVQYQMDVFDRHGLKGVFFVDPMPALIWGVEAITDIVEPIVTRGHDVQLHVHTEWLELAGKANPLGDHTGNNIADFTHDQQVQILEYARDTLIAAGARTPVAFRSGNYGSNDDTVRALSAVGLDYETSHTPGIDDGHCEISLSNDDLLPVEHEGAIVVPIGCVDSFGGSLRHAQITALSAWELLAAIRHACAQQIPSFTIVSHSFELLSRDRQKINRIVKNRFDGFCAGLSAIEGAHAATYAASPPEVANDDVTAPVLPLSEVRSGIRLAEQALSNILYGSD